VVVHGYQYRTVREPEKGGERRTRAVLPRAGGRVLRPLKWLGAVTPLSIGLVQDTEEGRQPKFR
jgi:hypothetical protein